MNIIVKRIAGGFLDTNCYVVHESRHNRCIVIDPGFQLNEIEQYISTNDIPPDCVLCTHGHFDHIAGAASIQEKYKCEVLLSSNDKKIAIASNFLLMNLGRVERITLPKFTDANNYKFKSNIPFNIQILESPGHTPGSVVIDINKFVFTGDTFFGNRIGFSTLPGSDSNALTSSLHMLYRYVDNSSIIYPGHGTETNGMILKSVINSLLNLKD